MRILKWKLSEYQEKKGGRRGWDLLFYKTKHHIIWDTLSRDFLSFALSISNLAGTKFFPKANFSQQSPDKLHDESFGNFAIHLPIVLNFQTGYLRYSPINPLQNIHNVDLASFIELFYARMMVDNIIVGQTRLMDTASFQTNTASLSRSISLDIYLLLSLLESILSIIVSKGVVSTLMLNQFLHWQFQPTQCDEIEMKTPSIDHLV